ncbi:MAG: ankyrin repeat domain-containing protein [Bryobacteraceae bacterium]
MSGDLPSFFPTRRLPSQPNLEQLRKQAKDLLSSYRSGEPAAVDEVTRYELRPDPRAFALADAQRVLARAYGYASWARLKAFVDGVNLASLIEAVQAGNTAEVRRLLGARPELVNRDISGGDEHRALHYAVLQRDAAMVKLLMEAGADARKGIYPHREPTTALALARDREYTEIVAVIEEEERARRAEMSCPNATISPVQDEIGKAMREGDREAAIRLLEADGSLIQACDRKGATPLHVAAQVMDEEMVEWLLQKGANPRKADIQGRTPLDYAATSAGPRNEDTRPFRPVAERLLERGADMTIRGAVALGDAARVRELITAEPALLRDVSSNGGGLLTVAVTQGQIAMVSLLLDLGADVDERVMLHELEEPTLSWGMPLWHAALAGNYEITKLLLDRGADPNANVYASGWPLRNAWEHEDQRVKLLLLERGAKMQPHMIAEAHDVNEARRLLEADSREELASDLAWSAADSGCAAIVELALQRLNWPADDERWHWVLIQPIRGAGDDSNDNGGHFASMEVLLRRIHPNVSRYGQTVLHFAAGWHGPVGEATRARFAGMLLDHAARMDVRDDMLRSTALGWACRWGRTPMVELLIGRGAPVDEPDAEPWATPVAWAEKMGHRNLLPLLRR